MNSRRGLGVAVVVILIAAVWAVARVTRPVGPFGAPAASVAREGTAASSAPSAPSTSSGAKIPLQFYRDRVPVAHLVMKDLDGSDVSSADWAGKVVIVNFWATWCPPCRAEIPDLIALQNRYKDQLVIIGISDDDDPPETVKKWAVEHKMNYPIVMNSPELRRAFAGVTALPTSFIVDRESRIAMRHVGMLTAAVTEAETRHLAGLAVNATVEEIEKDKPTKLANAAQTTEIPGVDLKKLSKEQRIAAIQKLNDEGCTCGCNLTVARCRVDDPSCPVSLPRAKEIVASITSGN
jgi:thiol-disulfide isomerase/thioredoxin